MSKKNQERRKHPRKDVCLWAEEHVQNSKYFHLISNLSLSGLMLQKEIPFPVGHKILLKLDLPDNSKQLFVHGIITDNYRGSAYKGTGVKFTDLGRTEKNALKIFLSDPGSDPDGH